MEKISPERFSKADKRTQEAVATDLGVDRKTVRNAKTDIRENGKNENLPVFSKADKRQQVRDYIDSNPNASNREVATALRRGPTRPRRVGPFLFGPFRARSLLPLAKGRQLRLRVVPQ